MLLKGRVKVVQYRDVVEWMEVLIRKHFEGKHLDVSKRLGFTSNSQVSQVMRRDRKVPFEHAVKWAHALGLKDEDEIAHFRLLVRLSHAPEEVQRDYWKMRDRVDTAEGTVKSQAERIATLAERIALLEDKLASQKRGA